MKIEFVEFDCSWSRETIWGFIVMKKNEIIFRTTQYIDSSEMMIIYEWKR